MPAPFGALIFSCNGRGMGLYNEEAFDSRTLASYVPVPSAGFFCNGELMSLHCLFRDESSRVFAHHVGARVSAFVS